MRAVTIALAVVGLAMQPAAAHHSHASLNNDDIRLFQGVVTKFSWRAPHVYIQANVVAEDGTIREYKVEALNPPAMEAMGWSKDTFAPGDRIVWEGAHDKDVNRAYAGINWAETADGTRYLATAGDYRRSQQLQNEALAAQPVEPVTEIGSGSWVRIAPDGGAHPPIRSPSDDWPLTPAAAEDVANWSEDDNPINNCEYPGPPRLLVTLSTFQWSRPDENTILIDRDMIPAPRVIHLDPDAPRGEPSKYGHSVGRFDGDELIVETDNFVAETWGMYTGIDSSEQKKLVERYWLSDDGMRLNVEFTVTDPGVLTEPYTYTHQWKRVPDRPLSKAPCSLENAWFYKTADYGEEADVPDDVKAALGTPPADAGVMTSADKGSPWKLPLIVVGVAVLGILGWRIAR